jgi:RNA polymerase sigma-70 factor (ECF subfamily)
MAEPGEDPLIAGLAAGREEAFAALYDRSGPDLFRVARALASSPQNAEDAVQEVFLGLVRARLKLGMVRNLRAYLFAALRRAIARQAVHRNATILIDESNEPARATPSEVPIDQAVRLERALCSLPREQRELVTLKVDGGLTFAEIAQVLDISANTAGSRYRYALEKLRVTLEGYE